MVSGIDRSAKPFVRYGYGVASFGNDATWISHHQMGGSPFGRKCLFCRRNGEFRAGQSDWRIFFSDVRGRFTSPTYRTTRRDGLRRLSKAISRPDSIKFWVYLWDPLLTHFAS